MRIPYSYGATKAALMEGLASRQGLEKILNDREAMAELDRILPSTWPWFNQNIVRWASAYTGDPGSCLVERAEPGVVQEIIGLSKNKGVSIVEMMTHNSHLDDFFQSHMRLKLGLPPVTAPADVHSNTLTKWAGLYPFERHRFGYEKLYTRLQKLVFQEILFQGMPVAVAIQKGRSYSGLLMPEQGMGTPFPGMLVEFQEHNPEREIYLLFRSYSYAFVPEDEQYMSVIYGGDKGKVLNFIGEILGDMSAITRANHQAYLPVIAVTHRPLSLKKVLQEFEQRGIISFPEKKRALAEHAGNILGDGVVAQPIHLFAYAVSQAYGDGQGGRQLETGQVYNAMGEAAARLASLGRPVDLEGSAEKAAEPLLGYFAKRGILEEKPGGYLVTEKGIRLMTYYGNMIAHHFTAP